MKFQIIRISLKYCIGITFDSEGSGRAAGTLSAAAAAAADDDEDPVSVSNALPYTSKSVSSIGNFTFRFSISCGLIYAGEFNC